MIDSGVIRKTYVNYPAPLDYIPVIRFMPGYFHKLFNLPLSFFRYKNIIPLHHINSMTVLAEQIYTAATASGKIDLIESL